MAATITNNLTVIADADATSPSSPVAGSWSSSGSGMALDTAEFREATGAICSTLRSSGDTNNIIFTRSSGVWNFQNTHIYIWFNFTATKFAVAYEIRVGDGTNIGYWTVVPDYAGGWVCAVIDTSRGFNRNSGADPSLSSITNVGINIRLSGSPRNATNCWVDIMRFGNTGITVTGGTAGDPATWENIYQDDASTADGKAHGQTGHVRHFSISTTIS